MRLIDKPVPASVLYKACYLVFDMAPFAVLLERFRDPGNAHEFSESKALELGRRCIVREASVASHVKLVDEK